MNKPKPQLAREQKEWRMQRTITLNQHLLMSEERKAESMLLPDPVPLEPEDDAILVEMLRQRKDAMSLRLEIILANLLKNKLNQP